MFGRPRVIELPIRHYEAILNGIDAFHMGNPGLIAPLRRGIEMAKNKPEVAIGHLVMHVAEAVRSAEFYEKLGLRIVEKAPQFSLVELRGGTHILFLAEKKARKSLPASRKEDFDLMISGVSRDDLKIYWEHLKKRGLSPRLIERKKFHGHYVFQIDDPDGNIISIYTSHSIGRV